MANVAGSVEKTRGNSGYLRGAAAGENKRGSPALLANEIARRAYELYENSGRRDGHDLDHWLQAEKELMSRSRGS